MPWNLGLLGATAAPAGAFELIQTQLISSNTSTVTFSNIPQTFRHLELRFVFIGQFNGGTITLRLNGDSSSNYSQHGLLKSVTTVTSFGGSSTAMLTGGYNVGSNQTIPMPAIASILDYASTTKFKTMRSTFGIVNSANSNSEVGILSGAWRNTEAITSITADSGGANWANGSRLSLYGIRG